MSDLSQNGFSQMGISPELLKCLERLNFSKPTPIQEKAIPIGVKGEDLIGIAQTGTGKTLAFSIPMLQRMWQLRRHGLVLLPTRELAVQVDETLKKIGHTFGLRTAILIGGENIRLQIRALKNNPHVIVATPGRLIDHLEQKTLSLYNVGILVLDEADRMLDMGFEPQIKKILAAVPTDRQTMLFSATMPEKIAQIASKYMQKPLHVEVAPAGTTAERVEQELFIVSKQQKMNLLMRLLDEYEGAILVFSRTKHGAKNIAKSISQMHSVTELHSNRSLGQRRASLEGFKSGKYRVLVATDIAARGIDVTNIALVINYDLPQQSDDYVHRIGRTARAGKAGKAISFACPDQKKDIMAIERLIRSRLPVKSIPGISEQKEFQQNVASQGGESRFKRFGGRGRRRR